MNPISQITAPVAGAQTRVAILGTGFSGLGMAIRLKRQGFDDFVVLERAADLGGTWHENTYPGCACDIQSHLYSFSFAPNPNWSRAYSPQPEIQAYLRACAERFGVLPHIRWQTELREAAWDEANQRWRLSTSRGELTADVLILGNGPLNEPSLPAIPGIEGFAGTLFHSARWRHDVDLAGKRVAVIGTGASSIQIVPQIQPQVAHLTLFQRTPPWIVPRLDHPIAEWQRTLYRRLPVAQRLVRAKLYWQHELAVLGLVYRSPIMRSGVRLAERHLAAQVPDPALRAKLTPRYAMGCKRILVSDDFYPALARPNVALVTERIREVRGQRLITEDGAAHEMDVIICGTGFHVTNTHFAGCVRGRDGRSLAECWREGPRAYLGTAVAGFPNLFLLIGPNTGLGHNSMVFMIESQIAYILGALRAMARRGWRTVEVRAEAQKAFNEEMRRRMGGTVWASGCASWYLDAGGYNATLWPGFTAEFWWRTRRFDARSYELAPRLAASRAVGARAAPGAQSGGSH